MTRVFLHPDKWKLNPYAHQIRGVKTLLANPVYGLFWQMRTGKTKTVIDAACELHNAGLLQTVVLAVPAQVKDVWGHRELGEVKKHCWVDHSFTDMDGNTANIADMMLMGDQRLRFLTISHELLRQCSRKNDYPRAYQVKAAAEGRVWLVIDEASAFGSHKSDQTKAMMHLRHRVLDPARVTSLDGTPIGNSPVEQYSKFGILDPKWLGYSNFFHFRAVHQVAEPSIYAKRGKKYVGFQGQDIIDRKVKGHCEYLASDDVLDMPKKVTSFLNVKLRPKTWRVYEEMRDELVAELDSGVCAVQHAAVKTMRLAQICAGFLGGVAVDEDQEVQTVEVGDETCDAMVEWLSRRFQEDASFKCVVWCRWRPEIERLYGACKAAWNPQVWYGQRKTYANQLHLDSQYQGPCVLVAQPQAIRYGVSLAKADTEVYLSQNYDNIVRQQSEERIQAAKVRPHTFILEVLVEGPQGQHTVTWDIKACLDGKQNVATRTTGEWKRALTEA